ncbi:uncharacterized protein PRCAT00001866001 [Priceomyces carsonii]|uniref:uncharacterized protein n=1 Tax=Priceomyces carsonii TaxID=28549 RepID=UPI002EDBAE11|nr:unnamed protein product [Priceomyces carsonii]
MSGDSSTLNLSYLDTTTSVHSPAYKNKAEYNLPHKRRSLESLTPIDLNKIIKLTSSNNLNIKEEQLIFQLENGLDDLYQKEVGLMSSKKIIESFPDSNTSTTGQQNPLKETFLSLSKGSPSLMMDFNPENCDKDNCVGREGNENILKKGVNKKIVWLYDADFFTAFKDPKVPYILSLYLQLFLNLLMVSAILYFLFLFTKTIRSDINQKIEIYTTDAMQEINLCSRHFFRNKCSTENGNKRVPALEGACTSWSKCMNRDPQLIGKSMVTAETFADIINGFLKPITWKSLALFVSFVFGTILTTKLAYSSYRTDPSLYMSTDSDKIRHLEQIIIRQEQALEKYHDLEKTINSLKKTYENDYYFRLPGDTRTISNMDT